jgi:hypothetical protein
MSTTSKLGADMTDGPIATTSVPLLHYQDLVRKAGELRALLARQPAAIGNEADDDIEEAREILENMVRSIELDGNYSTEATCTFLRQALNCLPVAAPLANEASKPAVQTLSDGAQFFACYLIDNFENEVVREESVQAWLGKMLASPRYHPAAPPVEQDERGAISEHDAKGIEIIASWMDRDGLIQPAEFLRSLAARAASTSANVAQTVSEKCARLAELYRDEHAMSGQEEEICNAIAEACRDYGSTNVAQGAEAVVLQHVAVAEDGGKLRWMSGRRPRDCELYAMHDGGRIPPKLYAAPPAQTALTDDARDAAFERYADALLAISRYAKYTPGTAVEICRIAHKALYKNAAQSASGDTK